MPIIPQNPLGALTPFVDALAAKGVDVVVSGLRDGAVPLAVSRAVTESAGPSLIVVPDPKATRTMLRDLRFFFGGEKVESIPPVFHYPGLDVSPFESISPHHAILGRRMSALSHALRSDSTSVLVAPVEALMEKVIPREIFSGRILETFVDDLIDRDEFAGELVAAGYSMAPLTEDVGDFSVRGGIIDVFCPLYERPFRIELDDIEVRSIRFFDPATQVSRKHVQRVKICPARQIVLNDQTKENFSKGIKDLADSLDAPKQKRDQYEQQVEQSILFPGVEFFLPLFYPGLVSIFDYLPPNANVFVIEPGEVERARDAFEEKVWARRARAGDAGKIVPDVDSMYLSAKEFEERAFGCRQVRLGTDAFERKEGSINLRIETGSHEGLRHRIIRNVEAPEPLAPLAEKIRKVIKNGGNCVLVSSSASGADRLERMLRPYEFDAAIRMDEDFTAALSLLPGSNKVPILTGRLSAGFDLTDGGLSVICDEEVFGKKRRTESVKKFRGEAISSFSDISEDDYIVHVIHGVGIYRGLTQLDVGAVQGEYLLLEYAQRDKLYVPVHRLNQVQRFVGSGGSPTVDKLGGFGWEKAKKRARASARAIARELLRLYAKRAAKEGFAFAQPDPTFAEFEATFPFEETPDQITAIADVIEDMTKSNPMDRLVCGDVGFGKTEIALRASFLAALSGKQVAVLVPTTTLAFQHHRTFNDRLSPFGVKVAMLSRFTLPGRVKTIYKELEAGKIDVVVGTHKLLSQKLRLKDMGLLIVDEEQHFGVVQKEKLKKLKEEVDVLAMTATPIPRTLNMALSGIRDLSVINTPPEDRLAVRTFVSTWDSDTMGEAIARELQRGGQIFFVHNRIRTIDTLADKVRELAPNARIRVAHGQMPAKQIEDIMIDFADRKVDILVSTAIIESGLDFPTANTIIIHRADMLGLSQLYQLRGRVGRAKRRAYCYLIIPGDKAITKDARKRLSVLRTFTELGAGYKVAARDLEIRGAGNLLGEQQSGHIDAVGYEMFTQLLEIEIKKLQGQLVQERIDPEINLQIPAFIPEEYVPDVGQRLALYKKLSDAHDLDQAAAISDELRDRFGAPPAQVRNLQKVIEIKIRARELSIKAIEAGADTVTYTIDDRTSIKPSKLVALATGSKEKYTLAPGKDGDILVEKVTLKDADNMFKILKKTLQVLV